MKFFKNICLAFAITGLSLSANIPVVAKQINNIIKSSVTARVLQVLSSDTIKVELSNKDTAYIKLRGIDTKGFDESFDFLTNTLLGQTVTLVKDGTSYNGGQFNYMVVYLNGVNINEQMVANGYAVIDKKQDKGTDYTKLALAQDSAKEKYAGMWVYEDPNFSTITGFSGGAVMQTQDKININTASKTQLQTLLLGINDTVAQNIISYREHNPFSNIQEIKFVEGFTKKMYDDNKYALTVSTNINKANEFELRSLGIADEDISNIVEKRNQKEFTSITQLKSYIPRDLYYKIENYVSITDQSTVKDATDIKKANVGLSDTSYLTEAGAPYKLAKNIVSYRENGYTYKTLSEVAKLGTENISLKDVYYLQDTLDVYTNLNTENKNELVAIFGTTNGEKIYNATYTDISQLTNIISTTQYNKVKANVYVDTIKNEYININTATKEQMQEAKLSTEQINKIIAQRPITNPSQFHIDVSNVNDKISIYTNINTASEKELKSLNNNIDDILIQKILKYRKEEPFGSIEEVEQFFKDSGYPITFKAIKNYIVVR